MASFSGEIKAMNHLDKLRLEQCWSVEFNEEYPFDLYNFKKLQEIMRKNYNKIPNIMITESQHENLKQRSPIDNPIVDAKMTKLFGSTILSTNADKFYFLIGE